MNKKILLVLDWSNMMFRSLFMTHLFGDKIDYSTPEQINMFADKFTTDICYILKVFKPNNVLLAADEKHPWRKDVLSGELGYKSNRTKSSEYDWNSIFKASTDLLHIFKRYGVEPILTENGEADDMIAMSKELIFEKYKDWNIIIVSADADIRQLVDFKKETKQYSIVYNTIASGKAKKRKLYVNHDFIDWFNKPDLQDIFFSNVDFSKQYISRLLSNNSAIELEEINPNDVILGKIFCGDDGDVVPSFYEWYKNGKKYRITPGRFKKLKESLSIENIADLRDKSSLLKESISKIIKKDVDDIDCEERLQRQRVLVELNSNLFPEKIKNYKKTIDKFIENPKVKIDYSNLKASSILRNTRFEDAYKQRKAQEDEVFKDLDKYVDKLGKLF